LCNQVAQSKLSPSFRANNGRLETEFPNVLRKSGIKPPFRLYDLRHTYGTRAVEAGIDVFSVAMEEAQKKVERFRARQRSA